MNAAGKMEMIMELERGGMLCTKKCPLVQDEEDPEQTFVTHIQGCEWSKKARELMNTLRH